MANAQFRAPMKNDWKFSAWMMVWLLTHQTTTNCVIYMIHYDKLTPPRQIKHEVFRGFPLSNSSWKCKLGCRFFKRWIFKQNKHRKKDIHNELDSNTTLRVGLSHRNNLWYFNGSFNEFETSILNCVRPNKRWASRLPCI